MFRHALAAALAAAAVSAAADAPGPGYDARPRAQGERPAVQKRSASPRASPGAAKDGRASSGKPRAPVRVEAALAAGKADLTLTFGAAASNVTVEVRGTNGLEVTGGEQPIENGEFASGDAAHANVTFTSPEGRARLVVTVSGDFNGVRQATVASFAVGKPSAEQQKERERGVVDDGKGGKIKLSPAQER
jgi:hypothetical protein